MRVGRSDCERDERTEAATRCALKRCRWVGKGKGCLGEALATTQYPPVEECATLELSLELPLELGVGDATLVGNRNYDLPRDKIIFHHPTTSLQTIQGFEGR